MAKFNMSIIALGLSGELKGDGIAVNTLWPRTTIATAAVRNLLGGDALMRMSRTPEIMGDAAHLIFTQDAKTFTGRFCIDDTLLYEHGVRDFDKYRVDPELGPGARLLRAGLDPAAARRHARRAQAVRRAMANTIEITGIRIRPAIVPMRRPLNTRVGTFTPRADAADRSGDQGRRRGPRAVLHLHPARRRSWCRR